jgi:cell division protein FtsB
MTQSTSKRPERKRTGQLSGLQIMFAAVLAIGLVLGLNFTSLVSTGQPLQQLHGQVSDQISALSTEQAQLLREKNYVQSDTYVEDWARDEGKLVKPGEVLVVPVGSGQEAEATPEAVAPAQVETLPLQPATWELWWALFFDTAPPAF